MKMELLQGNGCRSKRRPLPPGSNAIRETREMGLVRWIWELWITLRANYRRGHIQTVKQMQVIELLGLGGRRQVALISCGAERFLIGCGPDQIHTILRVSAVSPSELTTSAKDA